MPPAVEPVDQANHGVAPDPVDGQGPSQGPGGQDQGPQVGVMMSQSLDRLGWRLWKQDRCILSKSHCTITVVFPGPPRWQCTVSVQVMCNA